MWLDIALGILLLVFLIGGFHKGFMCGIIGFVSGTISFAISVFTAKPVAKLMDAWINLAAKCDNIMHGLGRPLSILVCGVGVYVLCRLIFFIIGRSIKSFKSEHHRIDKVDKFAGVLLGIFKYAMLLIVAFTVVHLIDIIPLVNKTVDWLFKGSKVGVVVYDKIYDAHIWPFIEKLLPWKK
jgi:uncharacterized membrane protein required for colicin V production